MIYQLNGKNVKNKPKGNFLKIVEVPGKLRNYITKKTSSENFTVDFWISENNIKTLIKALKKSKGHTHFAFVHHAKENALASYINGDQLFLEK